MKISRLAIPALTIAVAFLFGLAPAPAGASPPATITGTLFHDANEDGVHDTGEPGLDGHPIQLLVDGEPSQTTSTAGGGSFAFSAAPGVYTLRADTDFHAFFCVDSFGSFDPLSLNECLTPEVPWAFTTAQEIMISAQSGQAYSADFGVREMDVMLIAGRAVYANSASPTEKLVEASHNGTKCGETELMSGSGHNYEIAVLGAGELVGCPEPGDDITFTVGGLPALAQNCSQPSCGPFQVEYTPTGGSVKAQGLVAVADYALFWGQELAYPTIGVPGGPGVYVSIDGQCENWPGGAIALKQGFFGDAWVGFNSSVPSNEIWAGCGYPGAEVHFRIGFNGPETGTVAIWEPGIHMVDIDLPQAVGSGDVNCDKAVDTLDALAFLKRLAAFDSDTQCWLIADVNCDGVSDVLDVLVILSYVAALPYQLPPACPPINQSGP